MELNPLDIEIGHLSVADAHRVHVPRLREAIAAALRGEALRAGPPDRRRPNDPGDLAQTVVAAIRDHAGPNIGKGGRP